MHIRLRSLMATSDGWGYAQGKTVQDRLRQMIEADSLQGIVWLSLDGVTRLDVSFARGAVLELAKSYRQQRGICLEYCDNDIQENIEAAANAIEQPLLLREQPLMYRLLGPLPSRGTRTLFSYILHRESVSTIEAAQALDLQVPNASNKLKYLWERGYLLRQERAAGSGGIEFVYHRPG